MPDPGRLNALRREVARIETAGASRPDGGRSLEFGIAPLDAALAGGLALGAVHEIAPAAPMHLGAATGFAVALARLAARKRRNPESRPKRDGWIPGSLAALGPRNDNPAEASTPVLWIEQDYAALEAGRPYGPGTAAFGLPMARLFVLAVRQTRDALWAMEEALKSGAVAAVLTELEKPDIDLTASRRLALAAADGGALGLVLSHHAFDHPSAAMTRWEVAAFPGARDAFGGLGATAFGLSLVKNRHGPTGAWRVSCNQDGCAFAPTLSLGMAQAARDRSDRAPLAHAG
jgi:protein ImuA